MMRWLRPSADQTPPVSEDKAVALARELCERENLPWKEPVRVRRRRGNWVVWTNAEKIGGNVEIIVDAISGATKRRWGPVSR